MLGLNPWPLDGSLFFSIRSFTLRDLAEALIQRLFVLQVGHGSVRSYPRTLLGVAQHLLPRLEFNPRLPHGVVALWWVGSGVNF